MFIYFTKKFTLTLSDQLEVEIKLKWLLHEYYNYKNRFKETNVLF